MTHFAFMAQFDWGIRLILASVCGGLIGYERKNKLKSAGVRTHMLVTMGSALIMIVSKYAFFDLANISGITLDPSRISAQVVSGIGFIGAGAILTRHRIIDGLTTATGLWVSAAIGLSIGGGMYVIGLIATICVLLTQIIVSKIDHQRIHNNTGLNFFIKFEGDFDELKQLNKRLTAQGYSRVNFSTLYYDKDHIQVRLHVIVNNQQELNALFNYLVNDPKVMHLEIE